MSPKLEIRLDRQSHAPGDPVSGTVDVVEGGRSRSLEVHLAYREKTRHYEDAELRSPAARVHQGDLQTGSSHAFGLELPPEAPPPYTSEHGEMYWAAVAKSDEFGPDTVEVKRVEVDSPRAAPVERSGGDA